MSRLIHLAICFIFGLPSTLSSFSYYPNTQFSSNNINDVPTNNASYRLPDNIIPAWYHLTVMPFLQNSSFKGCVIITCDVIRVTDSIVLHMAPDSYKNIAVSLKSNSQSLVVKSLSMNATYEMATFQLNGTLEVQNGINITIMYEGKLFDDMQGFYISTYNTTDNNNFVTHPMAITQFEATYARRAFPCFDEPALRAGFIISILRYTNQSSMSNMPLDSSMPDPTTDMVMDTYKPSPPMPTYLVAFGVSDLANKSLNQIYRVMARQSILNDTTWALNLVQPILDKIGSFLGIDYPLPKMDVVAIPDFGAGAMENWGLTTYREKYVVYNPAKNTWKDKFGVISVIAHEFGHQWFGDLVTPEWWSYAWLNEAFATYFEYTIPPSMDSQWGTDSSLYAIEVVQKALAADTGKPRPMTAPVYEKQKIEGSFDYVIYEKGGSVLRMIENFLTTPVWKEGLKTYTKANRYGTGTPNKLFSALQTSADSAGIQFNNLNETLQGWTTMPGYPLITVSQIISNPNNTVYNVSQAPYNLESNSNFTWDVLLTYTTQMNPVFNATMASKQWIYSSTPNTSQIKVNDSGWVIFNIDQIGFYRVNYDTENWKKLKNQLNANHTAISTINRAQLIDDAFHLANTGHLKYEIMFGMVSYMQHETDYAPRAAFTTNMNYLLNQFYGTPTGDGLKKYAQFIISDIFGTMTDNLTQSTSTFMRCLDFQTVFLFACDVGCPKCEEMATFLFESWRKNKTYYYILPEAKQTVMCTGLRMNTSMEAFMDVLDYYMMCDNAAEKLTVMNSLGCITNPDAITTYLNVVCDINANHIRQQDRWIAFFALVSQQRAIMPVLKYITENTAKVNASLGPKMISVIGKMASYISQEDHINQVKKIVNDPTVNQALRNMLNSTVLAAVAKNQLWKSSQQGLAVQSWAQAYLKSSAPPALVNIILILSAAFFTLVNFN